MSDIKPTAADDLYDILLVPEKTETRVADQFGGAVIQNLAARRIIRPSEEALHKEWVEVYCDPGPSAHLAFLERSWDYDEPPYKEAVVRWGEVPVDVVEGGSIKAYFYVEFRGARFKDVGARFKRIFKDVTYARPRSLVKPHTGLPPHKEVPEDMKRAEAKRRKRTGNPTGMAGTHVEEF